MYGYFSSVWDQSKNGKALLRFIFLMKKTSERKEENLPSREKKIENSKITQKNNNSLSELHNCSSLFFYFFLQLLRHTTAAFGRLYEGPNKPYDS